MVSSESYVTLSRKSGHALHLPVHVTSSVKLKGFKMSSLVPSPPCEKWSRRQTRKPKGKLPMQLILQSQYTENPHNAYICGSLTSKFVVYSLTDVLRVVGCWCIVVVR